jgi:hypothetical protein
MRTLETKGTCRAGTTTATYTRDRPDDALTRFAAAPASLAVSNLNVRFRSVTASGAEKKMWPCWDPRSVTSRPGRETI